MRPARGFSLVEVLLATALLASGIALAFGALANAARATERAEAVAQRNERLRAVQAFLRRQVERAVAQPFEFNENTGDAKVFEVQRDEIRLVAPMPGYLSRGGPHLQTFRLVRGAAGLRLEFQHELLTPEGPLPNERKPEVLLDGIAEAHFDVRAFDDQGEPGPWTDRWDAPSQMPRLVRLQLRMREPRARFPALVVAPRLGQSPLPVVGAAVVGQSP